MDPIRVVGRIDLAEQIRAALAAAGADARVATTAPMDVAARTGEDGTGVDVLANGIEACAAIKKVAPGRPVVLIAWDDSGSDAVRAMAASAATTRRGPDAVLSWPATGAEILAACERARAAARVERPRITTRILLTQVALAAIVAAYGVAFVGDFRALATGAETLWPRVTLLVAQAGLFTAGATWSWARARQGPHRRWHRAWAVACALAAGFAALDALLAAAR